MRGYHKVKLFYLPPTSDTSALPAGWKPFAAYPVKDDLVAVVARYWVSL